MLHENYIEQVEEALAEELAQRRPGKDPLAPELLRLYALLVLTAGILCTNSDTHDAWSIWQNSLSPNHNSLVSYWRLTPEIQELDTKYTDAIRATARRFGG